MAAIAKLKRRAAELEQKKQFDRALELYIEILEEAGRDIEDADVPLFNRVGDLLMRQGRTSDALGYYERAVDVYAERGYLNNAIALCNKVLRQSPGRTSVYYKLGKISASKGFRSDARKNYLEYADRVQKAGDLDEAVRALKEFASLFPDEEDVRLILAEQLSRENRKSEALEQLQALYSKLESEGRRAEARATIDRMKAIDPEIAPPAVGASLKSDLVFLDLSDEGRPRSEPNANAVTSQENASVRPHIPALQGLTITFVPEDAARPTPLRSEATTPQRVEGLELSLPFSASTSDSDSVLATGSGTDVVAPNDTERTGEFELVPAPTPLELDGAFDRTIAFVEGLDLESGPTPIDLESELELPPEPPASAKEVEEVDTALVLDDAADDFGEPRDRNGQAIIALEASASGSGEASPDPSTALDVFGVGDLIESTKESPDVDGEAAEAFTRTVDEIVGDTGLDAEESLFEASWPGAQRSAASGDLTSSTPTFGVDQASDGPAFPPLSGLSEERVEARNAVPSPSDALPVQLPVISGAAPTEAAGPPDEMGAESVDLETERRDPGVTDTEPHVDVRGDSQSVPGDSPTPTQRIEHTTPISDSLAAVHADAGPLRPVTDSDAGAVEHHEYASRTTVSIGSAEAHLRRRLELEPENWALRRQLGEALLDSGDREEGMYELELTMIGYELEADLDRAREVVDEILRVVPTSVRHHQKRVEYAVRARDRERLIEAYLELADALFRTGEATNAVAVYARVHELAPQNDRASFALSTLAPERLEQLRATPPRTGRWSDELAVVPNAISSGEHPSETSSVAEKESAPNDSDATREETHPVSADTTEDALAEEAPGDEESSAEAEDLVALESVDAVTPVESLALHNHSSNGVSPTPRYVEAAAETLEEVQAPVEADESTAEEVSAPPPEPEAVAQPFSPTLERVGAVEPIPGSDGEYVDLGDWLRALEPQRSTRMVVDDAKPTGDEQADFAEMLRRFKRGVAENMDAEDFEAHYDLGVAYKEMGLVDEAISEFQKALRGETNRLRAYEALGQCFVEKEQYAIAAALLQRAVEMPGVDDQQLVGVLYLLATAYEQTGREAEALRYYQRVFAVDLEFRDITQRLAAMERLTK